MALRSCYMLHRVQAFTYSGIAVYRYIFPIYVLNDDTIKHKQQKRIRHNIRTDLFFKKTCSVKQVDRCATYQVLPHDTSNCIQVII
jgi:hypothetical protein